MISFVNCEQHAVCRGCWLRCEIGIPGEQQCVRCSDFVKEALEVGSGQDGTVWYVSRIHRTTRVLKDSWAEKFPNAGQSLSAEISLLQHLSLQKGAAGFENIVRFRAKLQGGGYSVSHQGVCSFLAGASHSKVLRRWTLSEGISGTCAIQAVDRGRIARLPP
jgi:hypothetical protein